MSKRSLVLGTTLAVALAAPLFAQSTTTPTTPSQPGMQPGQTTPGQSTPPGQGMQGQQTMPGGQMSSQHGTGLFYDAPLNQNNWRASDTINRSVYNNANERIGEVNELILDNDGRVVAAILGIGGFLGIGEREVAVNFRQLQMMRGNDGTARLVVNVDRARLEQAPRFQRPDWWRRS